MSQAVEVTVQETNENVVIVDAVIKETNVGDGMALMKVSGPVLKRGDSVKFEDKVYRLTRLAHKEIRNNLEVRMWQVGDGENRYITLFESVSVTITYNET